MPLSGTLDIDAIAADAPTIDSFDGEPLTLPKTRMVQSIFEIETATMQDMLPPAAHPTIPPTLYLLVLDCPASDVGPVTMAQVRIGCRTGIWPRNYLVSAVVEQPEAAAALSSGWGYKCLPGSVRLKTYHDVIEITVARDGAVILDTLLKDPRPLAPGDVWYAGNVNLAHTPRGRRLVHVEPVTTVSRADRCMPEMRSFDGAAWGEERIKPVYPVSGSSVVADLEFVRPKQLNVPDVPGLEGGENLD